MKDWQSYPDGSWTSGADGRLTSSEAGGTGGFSASYAITNEVPPVLNGVLTSIVTIPE